MDFLATARLLMALRKACPGINYHFDGDVLKIHHEVWVLDGVPQLFEDAKRMFEPAE